MQEGSQYKVHALGGRSGYRSVEGSMKAVCVNHRIRRVTFSSAEVAKFQGYIYGWQLDFHIGEASEKLSCSGQVNVFLTKAAPAASIGGMPRWGNLCTLHTRGGLVHLGSGWGLGLAL